jgi:hypothetical protein
MSRLNIEFFIGLRNTIEHRFQDAFIVSTAAHAHAFGGCPEFRGTWVAVR